MGLFGDKLILEIFAQQPYNDLFNIQLVKVNNSVSYVLPYSSISLLNSQLTVLSEYQRSNLCKEMIEFIENPEQIFDKPKLVVRFTLQLFQRRNHQVYNQFFPLIPSTLSPDLNPWIEKDIVNLILHFVSNIFHQASQVEQNKMRIYLLISIIFFQQQLLPIIKGVDMNNIRNKEKIIIDQVNFSNSIFSRWKSPSPFELESDLYFQHLRSLKNFNSY